MADAIKTELETIRKRNLDGELLPEEIVEYAKNPSTALHGQFEWNDAKCGAQHRLWQARQIVRVYVKLIDTGKGHKETTRAYVSIKRPDNGSPRTYVSTESVLKNTKQRAELVGDILGRIDSICKSYPLPELEPVREGIDKARRALVRQAEAGRGRRVKVGPVEVRPGPAVQARHG